MKINYHRIIYKSLEDHYMIKYSLLLLFFCYQIKIILFLRSYDIVAYSFYLLSCFIGLLFCFAVFNLLQYDLFKPQPFVRNMTYLELYQRYQCQPKLSKKVLYHDIVVELNNDMPYYNSYGKFLNTIVIFYFKYRLLLIFIGIFLNFWLVIYMLLALGIIYKQYYGDNLQH